MNDELIDQAELGEEARNFMGSKLGQKMLELANEQAEEALISLGDVDPSDEKKIRELQMTVKFGKSFANWLLNICSEGEQAIQVWTQQQKDS